MREVDAGLLAAARMGERRGIQKWLDRGASLDANRRSGETALMLCSNLATRQWLLSEGAPVEARDASGWTALFHASTWHKPRVVRLLLEAGADVNTRDNGGRTPLMGAAWP